MDSDMDSRIKSLFQTIKNAKTVITKINGEKWKEIYYIRCKEHFIDFEKFINDLAFWNDHDANGNITDTTRFKEDCMINIHEPSIPAILEIAKNYKFTQLGTSIPKMICKACACENCPSLKSHLGYTCKDCKNNGYEGYNGYCDE